MIKVLLIEDDEIVQFVHREMLGKLGCSVDTAANGSEALEALSHYPDYTLIFSDIGLPDMNGHDLIKMIREKLPETPIITLTGFISEEQKTLCFNSGTTEVLNKPVSKEDLQKLLHYYT